MRRDLRAAGGHRRRADRRRSVARIAGIEAEHVFVLPLTPNGSGVAAAWSAAGDDDPDDAKPRLLIVSGDEAATDPGVRAMAAEAETR